MEHIYLDKLDVGLSTIDAIERLHDRNRALNEQNIKQKQVIFRYRGKMAQLRRNLMEYRTKEIAEALEDR